MNIETLLTDSTQITICTGEMLMAEVMVRE